jgi:hypothetical protein
MIAQIEPLSDIIPLTPAEKVRLAELESTVQAHVETFLTVGRALAEIRNKRLYRQYWTTFEDYCLKRWGFSGSRGLDLVRSAQVAEHLLAGPAAPENGDAPLPADLSPDTLRPLQKLQPELQSACWKLASRITDHPTNHVVSKIVRTIQAAINQGSNGCVGQPKPKIPQSERKLFLLSIHKLADNSWFNAHLVVADLDAIRAQKLARVCQTMITRCHEILEELREARL